MNELTGSVFFPSNQEEETQPDEEIQKSGNPEIKNSRIPDLRNSGMTELQKSVKRTEYSKVGYRLRPDALFEIEQIKLILNGQHKIKISREAIVEEAIRLALQNLEEKKQESHLVRTFSRIPEFQK